MCARRHVILCIKNRNKNTTDCYCKYPCSKPLACLRTHDRRHLNLKIKQIDESVNLNSIQHSLCRYSRQSTTKSKTYIKLRRPDKHIEHTKPVLHNLPKSKCHGDEKADIDSA